MNNPIATRLAPKNMLPKYCDVIAPQSMSPAVVRLRGMPSVTKTATVTKINPDKNLLSNITHALIGCVNNVSKVPSLCSSDSNRIVAAGINKVISHGNEGLSIENSTVKSGCKDASPIKKAVLKKDQEDIATNITKSKYPVG